MFTCQLYEQEDKLSAAEIATVVNSMIIFAEWSLRLRYLLLCEETLYPLSLKKFSLGR